MLDSEASGLGIDRLEVIPVARKDDARKKARKRTGETIMRFRMWSYTPVAILAVILGVVWLIVGAIWPTVKLPFFVLGIIVLILHMVVISRRPPKPPVIPYVKGDPVDWEEVLKDFRPGDTLYDERLHWLELKPAWPKLRKFAVVALAVIIISFFYPSILLVGLPVIVIMGFGVMKACSDWWYGRLVLNFVDYGVVIDKPYIFGGREEYGVKVPHIELCDLHQDDWPRWLLLDCQRLRVGTKVQEDDPRITMRRNVRDADRLARLLNALIEAGMARHY